MYQKIIIIKKKEVFTTEYIHMPIKITPLVFGYRLFLQIN